VEAAQRNQHVEKEFCYARIKYATCCNGLKCVVDASRAVLKLAGLVPLAWASETANGDDPHWFTSYMYTCIVELETLASILKPQVIYSASKNPAGLCLQERKHLAEVLAKAEGRRRQSKICVRYSAGVGRHIAGT